MDFFAHQDDARRRSKLLLFYYLIAVAGIIVATHAAVALLLGISVESDSYPSEVGVDFILRFWNLHLFAVVAGIVLIIIAIGTIIKLVMLKGGGHAVATALGGRRASPDTSNLFEKRAINVTEEMAIASGVPVPTLYILDDEDGINAFAAGHTFQDAVVGITKGCATKLTREQLQGVIAHEFSHILNADMKLNIRLIGILNGILGIYVIGRVILRLVMSGSGRRRYSRSSSKEGGAKIVFFLFGLALFVIGLLGAFFARLIQAAVSRQREYLADASAVQFTRNPNGIAGALKKIGGLGAGSKIESAHASEVSHMFFSDGVTSWFSSLFATHPPLLDRVKRIEPNYSGEFDRVSDDYEVDVQSENTSAELAKGFSSHSIKVNPETFPDSIGTIGAESLQRAQEIVWGLPEDLRDLAHTPIGSQAICFILLMLTDSSARARDLNYLDKMLPEVSPLVRSNLELAKIIQVGQRMPLLDLAIPALRRMEIGEYKVFNECLSGFLQLDSKLSLFEFILVAVLHHSVEREIFKLPNPREEYTATAQILTDLAAVSAALAKSGEESPEDAELSFNAGFDEIGFGGIENYFKYSECSPSEVCQAVNKLALTSPPIKREIVRVLARVVSRDGEIAPAEAELLRGVCESIDCPMPQF